MKRDPIVELYYDLFGPITIIMVALNLFLLYSWYGEVVPTEARIMAILFFGTIYIILGYARFKLYVYEKHKKQNTI